MKTVGIIIEYNPLHNGHLYHFRQSKMVSQADAVVAVMSGNFLQRGEPAVVNKWARTEMALHMGVDLVIELPVAFSSAPAEWFAYGAVSALAATGAVDALCFGSELGEIRSLELLANMLYAEPRALEHMIKLRLKSGISYPKAYAAAVGDLLAEADLHRPAEDAEAMHVYLSQPNNILGLHYLIALKRLNSRIRPLTISRQKAGYHQQTVSDDNIASATAIRKMIFEKNTLEPLASYVPSYTRTILRREWDAGRAPIGWNAYALPLLHQIVNSSIEELRQIFEMSEGLEYRLKRAIAGVNPDSAAPVEDLIAGLKTKRYTRTKLQRVLTRVLLNHRKDVLTKELLSKGVPYLRILGFSAQGRELLKQMKKTASVPVVTKIARETSPLLTMDIQATAVHALAYRRPDARDLLRDYYEPPLRI
ncbi:nucleotidyltransferase [Ferviditalea candida]|uniref:tRNA(Met) cytidine acetate ligase n=1 Tax=Ferviditalea candida TaxID=3108399 RepID=A0ABU5ZFC9_9BACL|nr:nucleotidyltransferase [Paenibacillaceae bacterium T2]